ncbi:MAG: hypothetical protein AAFN07_07780 [Pseudomonadota bacterium]
MLEHSETGITVSAAPARGEALDPTPQPIAVFLGRATSGPLQQPFVVESFAEFERWFGEPWAQSTLSTSVAQFFQHGGSRAVIVRIAANARGGTLSIPTSGAPLELEARNPGSTERLRASVDLHGISEPHRFNLTLQRLDPRTHQIVDQELFADLSLRAGDARDAVAALSESRLVLAPRRVPDAFPQPSPTDFLTSAIGYVEMHSQGHDGDPLSDYDFVGSDRHGTGLFSLDAIDHFDFLYACGAPGASAAGATFFVAAERYCESRNAMLMIDPPDDCEDTAAILGWRRRRPVVSAHCFTYFPKVVHRSEEIPTAQPAAGALLGLLCRHDARCHVFRSLVDDREQNSAALHRDWQPAFELVPDDAMALLRNGINPLIPGSQGRVLFPGLVTSANTQDRALGSLAQQRLAKFILARIERGTRWAVFAESGTETWRALQNQVSDFLQALAAQGAFKANAVSEGWWVQCDAAINSVPSGPQGLIRLLVGFQMHHAPYPVMYSITLKADGTTATRTVLQGAEASF